MLALLGVLAAFATVGAHQPARAARIGYLAPIAQPPREAAFRQELRRLGHVDGALVAYGPDYLEGFLRAAVYVHRILRGERPATLPVEQTTKFELVINALTARTIGVRIPPSLVLSADHVVE